MKQLCHFQFSGVDSTMDICAPISIITERSDLLVVRDPAEIGVYPLRHLLESKLCKYFKPRRTWRLFTSAHSTSFFPLASLFSCALRLYSLLKSPVQTVRRLPPVLIRLRVHLVVNVYYGYPIHLYSNHQYFLGPSTHLCLQNQKHCWNQLRSSDHRGILPRLGRSDFVPLILSIFSWQMRRVDPICLASWLWKAPIQFSEYLVSHIVLLVKRARSPIWHP